MERYLKSFQRESTHLSGGSSRRVTAAGPLCSDFLSRIEHKLEKSFICFLALISHVEVHTFCCRVCIFKLNAYLPELNWSIYFLFTIQENDTELIQCSQFEVSVSLLQVGCPSPSVRQLSIRLLVKTSPSLVVLLSSYHSLTTAGAGMMDRKLTAQEVRLMTLLDTNTK